MKKVTLFQLVCSYYNGADESDRIFCEREAMGMNKVKITVSKTTFDEEPAAEYDIDSLKACSMMAEGQMFYAD